MCLFSIPAQLKTIFFFSTMQKKKQTHNMKSCIIRRNDPKTILSYLGGTVTSVQFSFADTSLNFCYLLQTFFLAAVWSRLSVSKFTFHQSVLWWKNFFLWWKLKKSVSEKKAVFASIWGMPVGKIPDHHKSSLLLKVCILSEKSD